MANAFATLFLSRRFLVALAVGVVAAAACAAGYFAWKSRQPAERFARAAAALDAQRFREVERELEALAAAEGFEPHRHFLRGALLLENGKRFPALEEFGYAVDTPELRVRALTLSGRALYEAKRFPDAVGVLMRAIEEDPDAVEAHRWLASAYYDLGLNDQTMVHLARIAELDPRDGRPHRLMGLIRKDFENYRAAIDDYRQSLQRDPVQPDRQRVLLELAECHLKLHEDEDALAVLAEAEPSPQRWALEAEGQYDSGRVDEAERLLDQTLAASPAHLEALLLKGTILLEKGNAAGAREAFTRATIGYPCEYPARAKLIQACRRLGDQRAVEEQTRIAEELKRLREEFSKLHATAAAEPNNADVRCRLGALARRLDRADLARVWFQAALAINPQHAETLRLLAGAPPQAKDDRK